MVALEFADTELLAAPGDALELLGGCPLGGCPIGVLQNVDQSALT